ncbi:hypothetical protein [Parapedobacter soli]|uniref:hypothetical protein n=1 Tax=Parapedobacter soli TaxID=416955 RepID=UPI0021C6C09B|nr:hypothetical protein [Parapedobacter soli]
MGDDIEVAEIQKNNIEDGEGDFSILELKLLNLIAEIVVNISIREANEKSN